MTDMRLLLIGLTACLAAALSCHYDDDPGWPRGARASLVEMRDGLTLVARFVHVTDTHVVDEESPARFAGAQEATRSAWRPYESYAAQLFDGIVRTVNRIHASGESVDFLIHTGDACDNVQSNELGWVLDVLDGNLVDPLSGPDERSADVLPEPPLDSHQPFLTQGLYRAGYHGDLPSIPWYIVLGNHEVRCIGVFPIHEGPDGHRTAALPLGWRPGWLLPVRLDPVASFAYGNVTPAEPGPPQLLEQPRAVEPNPERAFFSPDEFIEAMFGTMSGPAGHGFADADAGTTWYSVSPAPGVRLIGLDTTDFTLVTPGTFYHEGALSRRQLTFLRDELDAAEARDELVIVASHHPSLTLLPGIGVEVVADELRAVLNEYPNVVLHVAGHLHRNRAILRGSYLEIETCSTLDWPQEGRLIEIWRDDADGQVVVTYDMFSHLDERWPPLGQDPLRGLREQALSIASGDKAAAARQKLFDPSGADQVGEPSDRRGFFVFGE